MNSPEDFFAMCRERYHIHLRRASGESPPWTDDPIFRKWRFCEVFREDDKTTKWFRENIREPLRGKPDVLLATVAFRWFNRVETGEKIKDILLSGKWDGKEIRRRLWLQQPVVTGAFMVKTPTGCDKLEGVCWCIEQFAAGADHLIAGLQHQTPGDLTLEGFWSALREFPFMGGFMAYEVVTDLRHTYILENASDIMTWANAGPGCSRGLSRIFHQDPDYWKPSSAKAQKEMLKAMQDLLAMSQDDKYWPKEWPRWEMRECEHGSCEADKYARALAGDSLKRKYP